MPPAGRHFDLVTVNFPCRHNTTTRDWPRLHLQLSAAKLAVASSASAPAGVLIISDCLPLPNLFPCKHLVRGHGHTWLYSMPDATYLRDRIRLTVGSNPRSLPIPAATPLVPCRHSHPHPTPTEFRECFLGLRCPRGGLSAATGLAHDAPVLPIDGLPTNFDWREHGTIGPVKNQVTSYPILFLNQFSPKTFIPALFGHTSNDIFVQPHHSDRIHQAYAGDKNLIKFEGDHNSPRPQFYYDSVSIFFYNVLQPPQFSSVCSNKLEKYYNCGALKVGAGTNESLLYEIINGLRATGTDAGSSSAAATSFTNGVAQPP